MALLTTIAAGSRWRMVLCRRVAWFLTLALLCSIVPRASAQTPPTEAYKLKAVFLFNFAQFVEWPAHAFRDAEAPLVIGILGEDPFGAYLDELVHGEKVGGRSLIARRYQRVEEIAECHILFISRSEAATLDKSLAQLRGRSVLTVGDLDTFTQQGGMVRFFTENGKIRFKINVLAAKA